MASSNPPTSVVYVSLKYVFSFTVYSGVLVFSARHPADNTGSARTGNRLFHQSGGFVGTGEGSGERVERKDCTI